MDEELRYKRFGYVYGRHEGDWWIVELFEQHGLNGHWIDKQKEEVRVSDEMLARLILENWKESGWNARATLVAEARKRATSLDEEPELVEESEENRRERRKTIEK